MNLKIKRLRRNWRLQFSQFETRIALAADLGAAMDWFYQLGTDIAKYESHYEHSRYDDFQAQFDLSETLVFPNNAWHEASPQFDSFSIDQSFESFDLGVFADSSPAILELPNLQYQTVALENNAGPTGGDWPTNFAADRASHFDWDFETNAESISFWEEVSFLSSDLNIESFDTESPNHLDDWLVDETFFIHFQENSLFEQTVGATETIAGKPATQNESFLNEASFFVAESILLETPLFEPDSSSFIQLELNDIEVANSFTFVADESDLNLELKPNDTPDVFTDHIFTELINSQVHEELQPEPIEVHISLTNSVANKDSMFNSGFKTKSTEIIAEPTNLQIVRLELPDAISPIESDTVTVLEKALPPNSPETQFDANIAANESPASTNAITARSPNDSGNLSVAIEPSQRIEINIPSAYSYEIESNEVQTESMSPRIRDLGNQLLQTTSQTLNELTDQKQELAIATPSIQLNDVARNVDGETNTARLLNYAIGESLEPVTPEFQSSGHAVQTLFAGLPIEPLSKFTEFDIFSAVTTDTVSETEKTANSVWNWSILAASFLGTTGWFVLKNRSSHSNLRDHETSHQIVSNTYDRTVRSTVQWMR